MKKEKIYLLQIFYYHESSPNERSEQIYFRTSLEPIRERLSYALNHPRIKIIKYKVKVRYLE